MTTIESHRIWKLSADGKVWLSVVEYYLARDGKIWRRLNEVPTTMRVERILPEGGQ